MNMNMNKNVVLAGLIGLVVGGIVMSLFARVGLNPLESEATFGLNPCPRGYDTVSHGSGNPIYHTIGGVSCHSIR